MAVHAAADIRPYIEAAILFCEMNREILSVDDRSAKSGHVGSGVGDDLTVTINHNRCSSEWRFPLDVMQIVAVCVLASGEFTKGAKVFR